MIITHKQIPQIVGSYLKSQNIVNPKEKRKKKKKKRKYKEKRKENVIYLYTHIRINLPKTSCFSSEGNLDSKLQALYFYFACSLRISNLEKLNSIFISFLVSENIFRWNVRFPADYRNDLLDYVCQTAVP